MKSGKKGALEMSVGTIVIIVLSMSMLILGMVLIKNIFSSANNAMDMTDSQIVNEINKMFVEDKKVAVNLPNQIAKIKQGEEWGVGFVIKNLEKGVSSSSEFSYEVTIADDDFTKKCGIGIADVENGWIKTGRAGSAGKLGPGEVYVGRTRFMIPEGAPFCIFRLNIAVEKDRVPYATEFFDLEVLA
ncbi:MAG: hypothetical protein V1888_02835 [archaeon]